MRRSHRATPRLYIASNHANLFRPLSPAEAISGLQTLERDYTGTAGRTTETDEYFNLSGVTYSTSPHIGTLNTDYYSTDYGFDAAGNPERVQDAVGTITDTLHDGLRSSKGSGTFV